MHAQRASADRFSMQTESSCCTGAPAQQPIWDLSNADCGQRAVFLVEKKKQVCDLINVYLSNKAALSQKTVTG